MGKDHLRPPRTTKFAIERLEKRTLLSVSLVKDLETTPVGTFDGDSQPLVPFGGDVYFELGNALYKSDGTAAGTVAVKDFSPFTPSSVVQAGSSLFFTADDGNGNWQLWKSDGSSAGTAMVAALPTFDPFNEYIDLTPVGSSVYFLQVRTFYNEMRSATLWVSDGTSAGTLPVADLALGPSEEPSARPQAGIDGKLVFASYDSTHGTELWSSDGTAAGTGLLADINPGAGDSSPQDFTVAGNELFFDAYDPINGRALWKTDGTAAGTVLVHSFNFGTTVGTGPLIGLTAVGSGVYFPAGDGLWHSDGTSAGTVPAVSMPIISPHTVAPTMITNVNGTMYVANYGQDLWKSDGTPSGTMLLTSFPVAVGGAAPSIGGMANLNGALLFAANDGSHGQELWRSDGTAAGTVLLDDIYPGATGSDPAQLAVAGGKLFFTATDPVAGRELWTSDGTTAGTYLVVDFTPGTADFSFGSTLPVGNKLFFTGGSSKVGLYVSDGTPTGTSQLVTGGTLPWVDFGGSLYFIGPNPSSQFESGIWSSDGTATGTNFVTSVFSPELMVSSGNAIYVAGSNLLKLSAGATTPTVVTTFSSATVISIAAAPNNSLYYLTASSGGVESLWFTDGSGPGAMLGTFSGTVNQLVVADGRLYFYGDDGTNAGLWTSDGTSAGTIFLAPMVPELDSDGTPDVIERNGRVYFFAAADFGAPTSLWQTDGTPAGTVPVAAITAPDGSSLVPHELTEVGNAIYFLASEVFGTAQQLWRTDGTAPGTGVVIPDIGGTQTGTYPSLAAFNGALYFPGNFEPAIGTELYKLDAGGITPVADINPGPDGSFPEKLTPADGILYFTADDGFHGRELWKLTQDPNSITGRVFNDLNHDGFQDPAEHGMAGVTIKLISNNQIVQTTTTDTLGYYTFANVAPGQYTVLETVPTGDRRTAPLPSATDLTVVADQSAQGPVFGEVQVSTVRLDFSYLVALARNYGKPGTFATGDLDGDGTVDFNDLLLLARNYSKPLAATIVA